MFIPVPTPEEMARWDAETIAAGISEEVLMENASAAAMESLRSHAFRLGIELENAEVLLLAGSGNNGGDAFCMARHLLDEGARPTLICTRDPGEYRGSAGHWLTVALRLGIPAFSADAWEQNAIPVSSAPAIVIDGLLGTGFRGPLREREKRLIEKLNGLSPRLVLAIDVPSGLDSRTGHPSPHTVRADVTVTLQAVKPGLLLPEASFFTGILEVRPIGIPGAVRNAFPPAFRSWLPPVMGHSGHETNRCLRIEHGISPSILHLQDKEFPPLSRGPAHKGKAGRVLVVGGSAEYAGAPCLAAWAALRTGAGLVTVAGPSPVLNAVRMAMPSLTTLSLCSEQQPERESETWRNAGLSSLIRILPQTGSIIFGPGLGRNDEVTEFARTFLSLPQRPPLVLDADALYLLALRPELLSYLRPCDVLTPHPGEAATLLETDTSEVQADRFSALKKLADLTASVWVLKGEGTLISIPGEPSVISPWNVPQLAVAGSGDVLAGIIGAFLARGHDSGLSAVLGVWAHVLAGLRLARAFPMRGNSPHDIAEALPSVLPMLGEPYKGEICRSF